MARFPRLRKTLQALVFAALPVSVSLGTSGCCAGYDNPSYHDEVELNPDGTSYGDMVKACRMDDSACRDLCENLVVASGMALEGEASFSECRLIEDEATVMHMTYTLPDEGCISGRRPANLEACRQPVAPSAVGAWLARTAHLEAASVPAFVFTARELNQFGAPPALCRRALESAADEVRHTHITVALARRYGVVPVRPQVPAPPRRGFLAFCLENEVEGCVRETYGAIVATWQAHMAADPMIRHAMVDIARDETEHAQLSADIRAWAWPRLSSAERAIVRDAREQAIDTLWQAAREPVPPALVTTAGLPSAPESVRLLAQLRNTIW